jgi:hypothetical protein
MSVIIYSNGLVHCSVCAPIDMDREAVTDAVNAQHPTGVTPWHISDEPFADGSPNPSPCNSGPGLHYLFVC